MDNREIRYRNVRNLVTERAGGSVNRFADLVGLETHATISQITGPARSRNVGTRLARRIEKALGLAHGWMDVDHSAPTDTSPVPAGRTERAMKIVRLIERLPDGARKLTEQLIDELADPKPKRRARKK